MSMLIALITICCLFVASGAADAQVVCRGVVCNIYSDPRVVPSAVPRAVDSIPREYAAPMRQAELTPNAVEGLPRYRFEPRGGGWAIRRNYVEAGGARAAPYCNRCGRYHF